MGSRQKYIDEAEKDGRVVVYKGGCHVVGCNGIDHICYSEFPKWIQGPCWCKDKEDEK